jgi:hypothetical protein
MLWEKPSDTQIDLLMFSSMTIVQFCATMQAHLPHQIVCFIPLIL